MKNPTIWETAGRPLFVRTIWLEGSELRRGLQRHFLWDYDTKRPMERLNVGKNALQRHSTDNLDKRANLLDINDFTDYDFSNEGEPEVFVMGSAKAKLHEPYKLFANKKSKLLNYHRRLSSNSRHYACYNGFKAISSSSSNISQWQSKKSSLGQSELIAESADVLLAERVVHWLDLVGKEDFFKNLHELKEIDVKISKPCKPRHDAIKNYTNKIQNKQKLQSNKTKKFERAARGAPQLRTHFNHKGGEAVKHVTIIFNKEGQPIHLKRPAENIDVYTLTSSPSNTRKLERNLPSARLYQSAGNDRSSKTLTTTPRNKKFKTSIGHRRLHTVADSTLQKRLHENPMQGSYNNVSDSKKQLHIFMPTLPKKSLMKSAPGTEDVISELSHSLNELCRI